MNTRLSIRLHALLAGLFFSFALPGVIQAAAPTSSAAPSASAVTTVQLSDGNTLSVQGRLAWLTDLKTQQRTELKNAPVTSRTSAALVVVPDGSVWILGGVDEQGVALRTGERYVPQTQRFEALPSTLDLIARSQHRATLLLDGRILITGGLGAHGQPLAQAELIDTTQARSQAFNAQLLAERSAHQATVLGTDHVLLQGGVGRQGQAPEPAAELFDTQAQRFMPAPANKTAATDHAAPQVSASLPADGAIDVNVEAAGKWQIGLRFNQAMKPESVNGSTVVLMGPSGRVPARVVAAEGGRLAFVTPTQPLLPGASYSVLVSQAQNAQGVNLTLWSASFKTRSLNIGNTAPAPVSMAPVIAAPTPAAAPEPSAAATEEDEDELWTPAGNAYKGEWLSGRADRALKNPPKRAQVRRAVHALALQQSASSNFDPRINSLPFKGRVGEGMGSVSASSESSSVTSSVNEPIPTLTLPLKGREQESPSPSGRGVGESDATQETSLAQQAANSSSLPTPPGDADGLPTAAPGTTALAGQVLRLNGKPLAHVTLRLGQVSTQTDANGEFLLTDVTPGEGVLVIDGRSAKQGKRSYGYYEYRTMVGAGVTNALPFIVWMPRLDTAHARKLSSPTAQDTVITHPKLPGLELRIPAGTVIRDRDGKIVTEVSITPVPVDQPPFPMPYLGVPIYFTLQPGGATLSGADGKPRYATLHYPNYAVLPPGAITELFDYDPKGRGWYVYGRATVSADTKKLESQQELRIYQFTSTSAASSGGTPGENDPPPCDGSSCCGGGDQDPDISSGGGSWTQDADQGSPSCLASMDPVNTTTGHMEHTERDLFINDLIPIDVRRVYRSGDVIDEVPSVRSFGAAMTHSYEMYLYLKASVAYVVFPNGSRLAFPFTDAFFRTPSSPQTAVSGRFYGAYLSRIAVSTGSELVLNLRDGTQWGFSYYGAKLKWIQDRNGNRLKIERATDSGPVNRVVSPSGRYVDFKYNTSNLVESISDHLGRKFSYTYSLINSQRLLTQVTDPLGGTRNYAWDARSHGVGSCKPVNRITQITDPNGHVMVANSYAWEPKCEVAGSTVPVIGISGGRGSAGGTYSGSGSVMQPVGVANPNPPATITEPCYISSQVLADGSSFTCTRTLTLVSGVYRISSTQVTDRRGNVRKAEFDANGRIVKNTFPVGKPEEQVQQYERDANGRLTAEIDALNRRTEYLYAAAGNLTQVTRLAGTANAVITSSTYNAQSQPLTVTNALGQITRFTYDAKGNLTKVTNALGQNWLITRNVQGQATQLTDPLGNLVAMSYDGPDLAQSTDPLGRQSTQFPDAAGRIVAVTSPSGAQEQSRYDVMNRRTQSTNAQGHTVQFEYDANGNLKAQVDEKGNRTSYAYNTLGKVMSKTDALNQVERYQYEAGGKLNRKTDRKGQVSGVTYDAHGRPTQIGFGATAAAPTTYKSTVSLTWDKGNRLTKIVDSVSGTINRSYDNLDRMTQEASPQGTIAYTYDKAGQRLSQTVTGQPKVSYTYNAAGQLTQISQAAGPSNNNQVQTVSFQYDLAGRRTKTTLANGSTVNYTYDKASQLTAIAHRKSDGSALGSIAYTYDQNGKRTSASGSLASVELPAAVTGTEFDANNRLTKHNGSTYSYDANGNLTSDGSKNYVWDERNQLKSMSGGAVASFIYDSMGRRIAKTVAGATTGYLYDGQNFVQERAGLGSATAVKANLLTGGVDETFLRSEAGSTATLSHFMTDANNNVMTLTNNAQSVMTSYKYGAYGETKQTGAANSNSQQYTGRENDQTGLMYYRARYYHLGCNRFISEDPIGWASGQTNNYAYVGGDPVGFMDPEGMSFTRFFLVTGGMIWAGYQGYLAGQKLHDLNCATEKRFQEREQNENQWTPAQDFAEHTEFIYNNIDTFGPFVVKWAIGAGLASVGGGKDGFFAALAASALGVVMGNVGTCQ